MIHVALFPADETGCGYYRMRLPADHAGVLTSFHKRARLRTSNDLKSGNVVLRHVDVGDADVAVFQRPMDHRLVPVIEQLKKQGVATVVELDDDLCALDPIHAAYGAMHPKVNPFVNWNHLKAACRTADLLTVSTQTLAKRYAGHGRVVVVPNYVDERLLAFESEKQYPVGWAGVLGTHPRDLDVLGDAIANLRNRYGWDFAVVGDAEHRAARRHACGILGLDDVVTSGWLDDMDDYWQAVASLAVGLVPLSNSAFNHAKSHLKGLEYAALGVPFVAGPLPEYLTLAADGLGRLASKPKRWERQIEQALADDEAAIRGREIVRDRYTIQRQGWRWAEAWAKAIDVRKHARRRAA